MPRAAIASALLESLLFISFSLLLLLLILQESQIEIKCELAL